MENNREIISSLIDYVEEHISEEITLEQLSKEAGYSMYHLHRMFSAVVGLSVHQYVVRRRLTISAQNLLFDNKSILTIALEAGYQSQQAYTVAFKQLYHMSPKRFRKKHDFWPIQLKFDMSGDLMKLKGDRIVDIRMESCGERLFAGFKGNTGKGFFLIPRLWKKLHKEKKNIPGRINLDFTVGLNDYSKENFEKKHPAFDYYAAVEVSDIDKVTKSLSVVRIPASKYMVFTYYGNARDSIEPVIEYIYKQWFPNSNSQLNDKLRMDFVRYGEEEDEKGNNQIEVWVPVIH